MIIIFYLLGYLLNCTVLEVLCIWMLQKHDMYIFMKNLLKKVFSFFK